jgi:hypothetical protein
MFGGTEPSVPPIFLGAMCLPVLAQFIHVRGLPPAPYFGLICTITMVCSIILAIVFTMRRRPFPLPCQILFAVPDIIPMVLIRVRCVIFAFPI